jgi:hypothetical protein
MPEQQSEMAVRNGFHPSMDEVVNQQIWQPRAFGQFGGGSGGMDVVKLRDVPVGDFDAGLGNAFSVINRLHVHPPWTPGAKGMEGNQSGRTTQLGKGALVEDRSRHRIQ